MIKRILIALIAIIFLCLGALFILPGLVPTDTYRTKLETELSKTLAREVRILGDVEISTFPTVKVQTGPVSLSNSKEFGTGNFVEVEAMSAKVRLWPLIRKQVEISGITLQAPKIQLERRADGTVNWSLNDTDKTTPDTSDSGPFKRDGRYTEYDPALDLLQISDGIISFKDAVSGKSFTATDINIDLRAPSLSAPLSLNGALIFDNLPAKIDATLKSPLDFLSGSETAFETKLETEEGTLHTTGTFKKSADIAFVATFDASSPSPLALAKRLPLPDGLSLPALSSLSASGDVNFGSNATSLPKLKISALGESLSVDFDGALNLSDELTAAGDFKARLDDMAVITPYLETPIKALQLVSGIEAEGNMTWDGTRLELPQLKSAVNGPELNASFDGTASFEETLALNGTFTGETPDLANLVKASGFNQEDAAALKRVISKGSISILNNEVKLSSLSAKVSEGLINGAFDGDITLADGLKLYGEFTGDIPDLNALDAALPRDIPYSEVTKHITLSSQINSTDTGIALSAVTASLTDGLLTGDFSGNLIIGQESDISGTLSLAANSLRAIGQTQNIDMPPSTDVGAIFEAFNLSGDVSGTPDRINFRNGQIQLDELSGTGNFILNMDQSTPRLTGALTFSPLDLRPYMAAWSEQKPEGVILPWSTVPINLAGLSALDAEIDITTPSVKLDRLELGTTEGAVRLKNGLLSTDIQKAQLYDGQVDGSFSISTVNGQPAISLQADVSSVAAQTFLKASAGLEKITGTANLSLSLKGQGNTQEAIMKSLTGSGNFNVLSGQLLGIDAAALLTGVDQALTNKQIPDGVGIGKTTNFSDLNGTFSLDQGRATIGNFKLESGALFMDAEGLIDLGGQRLDFGLRPQLAEGSDLAQFGIPLEISGLFGQAKAGLDTDMLAKIAAAKARQSAGSAIRDRVSGPLGDLLGGVIGGESIEETEPPETDISGNEASETEETTPDATEAQNPTPEQSPLGDTDTIEPATEAPETEETVAPEEQIENALKGLFGRKKKKSEAE